MKIMTLDTPREPLKSQTLSEFKVYSHNEYKMHNVDPILTYTKLTTQGYVY